MRTPAAGEHALVPLNESGEVVERLRRERLDREVGHAVNVPPIPDDRRPVASAASAAHAPVATEQHGRRADLDDPTRLDRASSRTTRPSGFPGRAPVAKRGP
jgi:hypothetical protein